MEDSSVTDLFDETLHPYAKGLMNSTPDSFKGERKIEPISGSVPDLAHLIKGCKFPDRCPYAMEKCGESRPMLSAYRGTTRRVRCFLYGE